MHNVGNSERIFVEWLSGTGFVWEIGDLSMSECSVLSATCCATNNFFINKQTVDPNLKVTHFILYMHYDN